MCLVIGVALLVLSVNFYLNGFVMQAVMSGIFAVSLILFMGKNISCANGGCKTKIKEDDIDDN